MRRGKTFEVVQHIGSEAGAAEMRAYSPYHHRHVTGAAASTGWKSPVPYLFGGLAAMLGLIAFALLILACSYWKLSGHMDSDENSGDDAGDGDDKVKDAGAKPTVFANSILVIMAGDEKPTFLATPATSRATSFGDSDGKKMCSCSCSSSSSGGDDGGDVEAREEVRLTMVTTTTTTTTETTSSSPDEEEKR